MIFSKQSSAILCYLWFFPSDAFVKNCLTNWQTVATLSQFHRSTSNFQRDDEGADDGDDDGDGDDSDGDGDDKGC